MGDLEYFIGGTQTIFLGGLRIFHRGDLEYFTGGTQYFPGGSQNISQGEHRGGTWNISQGNIVYSSGNTLQGGNSNYFTGSGSISGGTYTEYYTEGTEYFTGRIHNKYCTSGIHVYMYMYIATYRSIHIA